MKSVFDTVKRFQYELFALAGTVVVLWQLLLPGYVLTLDMVFGPHMALPSYSGLSAAGFPPAYILYLLHFILSGWVVEKVLMIALFFLLFYLPLRFYPFRNIYGEAYFAALLFAVNPFVYERFLAGQWMVLFAYALLFPFISCLIGFYHNLSWRSILHACGWLLVLGMFSLHFLVMGAVILVVYAAMAALRMSVAKEWQMLKVFLWRLCVSVESLCAASSYWLVPAFVAQTNTLASFTVADLQAFQTAGSAHLGVLGNVAALYGFWGEHQHWATYFISPQTGIWLWGVSGAALAVLVCLGLYSGLRGRTRPLVVFLGLVGILALVFSAGVSGIAGPFNLWLMSHVAFWRGFRDTQKWSGVLALVYALFGGLGISYLAMQFKARRIKIYVVVFACLLPLLYTPTMLFGFAGQLQPVWYPAAWAEANGILKQDPNCKAIFLPWHEYYTAVFNNRVLAASAAPAYFDCTMLTAANAEIGDVGDGAGESPQYYAIDSAITSNTADPDATVRFIASTGVRYILFTGDEVYDDPYQYPFLHSALLKSVVNTPSLVLYKIAQ